MTIKLGISEQALLLHSQSVSVVSENIANADTPNFKAKGIDFKSVLSKSSKTLDLVGTESGHMPIKRTAGEMFVVPASPSLDGNTVNIEMEKVKLMESSQRYATSLEFLSGAVKTRLKVIEGK